MKGLVAAIIGLAIAVSADPSAAYVAAITTSIPIASAGDDDQLKDALTSAIDDVLHHAIAFTPTVVTLQSARVVDDRIYILLLVADGDGEEMLQKLSVERIRNSIERSALSGGRGKTMPRWTKSQMIRLPVAQSSPWLEL